MEGQAQSVCKFLRFKAGCVRVINGLDVEEVVCNQTAFLLSVVGRRNEIACLSSILKTEIEMNPRRQSRIHYMYLTSSHMFASVCFHRRLTHCIAVAYLVVLTPQIQRDIVPHRMQGLQGAGKVTGMRRWIRISRLLVDDHMHATICSVKRRPDMEGHQGGFVGPKEKSILKVMD